MIVLRRNHLAKLIPFHPRDHRHEAVVYALALSARWERLSVGQPWLCPHEPERLGNMLQRLASERPALVFVIEKFVADLVAELDRNAPESRNV